MALYRINHPATGRVVNLYISSSTGSVPHGTPLSLYPWQNNSDQKFEMEYRGDYVIFRLQRDTSQVINRNASNNQAMVWPFSTDQATLNDSLINTETEGGNMRIKLVNQGLYLTKDSSSNMLYWQPKAATNRQYFTLQQVDGGGSTGGEHCITLPTNRKYCWSQSDPSIVALCESAGCSLTCVLDIANIFGPVSFTAKDVYDICGWGPNGLYHWWLPNACSGSLNPNNDYDPSYSRGNVLAVAKQQIDANNPIILKLTKRSDSGDTHFVVAYKYINQGTSTSDFYVLDPWEGVERTLADSMRINGKDTLYNYILSKR